MIKTLITFVIAGALALSGCGGDAGPRTVEDGSYGFFASSTGSGSPAMLEIVGDALTLTTDGGTFSATFEDGDARYVVCPPSGEGEPSPVSTALTIGDLSFAEPAIFGDCGEVAPARVTIVDLSTFDGGMLPVFGTWVELCDTSDPDC